MVATKCDICGTYVDRHPDDMPYVRFGYDSEDLHERSVCYECYSNVLDMFHIGHESGEEFTK